MAPIGSWRGRRCRRPGCIRSRISVPTVCSKSPGRHGWSQRRLHAVQLLGPEDLPDIPARTGRPTDGAEDLPDQRAFCVATLTAKTLRVRLHCPLGCHGNLNAHVGIRRQVRQAEGGQSIIGIGLPNVSIPPGGYAILTLLPHDDGEEMPTARALVRRLRRARRLDLRLEFRIDTPAAEGLLSEETTEGSGWFSQTFTHVVIPIRLQTSPAHRRHP